MTVAAWIQRQGGLIAPVLLLDIQTNDGTQYFWADSEGTYLSELTGANQFYNGWVKSFSSFTLARDLSTAAGDIRVQNVTGNTIDKDVALALLNHEFDGALIILRIWLPVFDAALDEFHGQMFEQNPLEDEFSFRVTQLFDPAQYDVAGDAISELCTFRFKSAQCGSTGSATVCDFRLTTCQDANHLAQERFNGVLSTVPTAGITGPDPGGRGNPPRLPPPGPGGPHRLPNLP